MCCASRYKRLLSAWNSSHCQEFAFGVKAVERAGGRILIFIHIFWISDHHLGRGATLENQPALKTKRGIVPRNCVYEDQGRTGGGGVAFASFVLSGLFGLWMTVAPLPEMKGRRIRQA
jgi:hypothetical protein